MEIANQRLRYKILNNGNTQILSGYFSGLKLTDIYIVFPEFFVWILNSNLDQDIKLSAKSIVDNGNIYIDNIEREINEYNRHNSGNA